MTIGSILGKSFGNVLFGVSVLMLEYYFLFGVNVLMIEYYFYEVFDEVKILIMEFLMK